MTSTASSGASTTVPVQSKQPLPDVARPESTATFDDPTSATQPGTAEGSQTSKVGTTSTTSQSASMKASTPADQSATSDHERHVSSPTNPVGPSMITKSQSSVSTTVGLIEGLVSAIQSVVAQQGGVSHARSSSKDSLKTTLVEPTSTTVSKERSAESVTGFAIGTEVVSPGGEAVIRGGSVYSALPSESGLRVVADSQTSTITYEVLPGIAVAQHSGSDNDYVVGDNTLTAGGPAITSNGNTISALLSGSGVRIAANGQTRIVPAAVFTESVTLRSGDSEDEYIFAGSTLSAGGNALDIADVTYSALESGSGIIMMAEDTTSTLSVGQAISASSASGSDLDFPSPLLLPAGSQQQVTSSVNIYTASTTLGASDDAGNATATATGINDGTTSAQGTGTVSSSRGLGGAIISGIGGGNAGDGDGDANAPDTQSSTDVEAASHATRRSVHVLLGGFCTFAFALALL